MAWQYSKEEFEKVVRTYNYFAKADDGKYYFIDENEYYLKAFDPQTQSTDIVCEKEGCDHLIDCDAYIDSLWYWLDRKSVV